MVEDGAMTLVAGRMSLRGRMWEKVKMNNMEEPPLMVWISGAWKRVAICCCIFIESAILLYNMLNLGVWMAQRISEENAGAINEGHESESSWISVEIALLMENERNFPTPQGKSFCALKTSISFPLI